MSQKELAGYIGATEKDINKWESGDIDISEEFISKLCQIFQLNSESLTGNEPLYEYCAFLPDEALLIELMNKLRPSGRDYVVAFAQNLVNSGEFLK